MAKKITKEDLKNPDGFIAVTDRIISTIEKNRKPLLGAIGLAVSLGLGVVIAEAMSSSKEQSAQHDLYQATQAYDKVMQTLNDVPDAGDKKTTTQPERNFNPEELVKHYGEVIPKFKYVMNTHPSSKAAKMAAIDLASLYSEYQDHSKAKEILTAATQSLKEKSFFYGLTYFQLGNVEVELGQCESAIGFYDKVLQAKKQAHLHPHALLRMGLCYESLSNLEAAREAYDRINTEFGESQAAQEAKTQIRLMTLKNKKTS